MTWDIVIRSVVIFVHMYPRSTRYSWPWPSGNNIEMVSFMMPDVALRRVRSSNVAPTLNSYHLYVLDQSLALVCFQTILVPIFMSYYSSFLHLCLSGFMPSRILPVSSQHICPYQSSSPGSLSSSSVDVKGYFSHLTSRRKKMTIEIDIERNDFRGLMSCSIPRDVR